jgi:lipopolysaccharide/colanic/teichoic acid biosynthesis glycosyltransferase
MREGIPMAKLDAAGDPRIIPWGHFLRATGLDELPQLFNVLRGEMSLVGPRPCTAHEFEHFTPYERQRADAVPGLTGYWQVNGKNQTTFDEMIALDIYYAQNLSFSLDLAILVRTIPTLIREASGIRPSPRVRRESEPCGLAARQEVNPG